MENETNSLIGRVHGPPAHRRGLVEHRAVELCWILLVHIRLLVVNEIHRRTHIVRLDCSRQRT